MFRIAARIGVAAVATAGFVALASPAQAAEAPAVVSCSFAGVYDSFEGSGSGLQGYAKKDDKLTAIDSNSEAVKVEVEDGFMAGHTGWIETDCVAYLA